jgi:hypothetical protein
MKTIILLLITLTVSIQLNGQCYPDRHNTNWYDGWISCETAPSPNSSNGDSHWILYDFNEAYELGQLHVWNTNDPANLDYGMREVSIDYSLDGTDWIHLGNYEFDQGSGKSTYEGFEGPHFEGALARYVLITGLSNYGGDCFGLSELRFAVQEATVQTDELSFLVDCSATEEGVLLAWTVDGSLDEVEYSIQRSADLENWTLLKTTEKYSLDEGKHTFHYIDNANVDGSAYYRLISRQNNGREKVSRPHFCSDKSLEARVYPNPMKEQADLEIISQEMDPIFLKVVDVFGRILYRHSFTPTSLTTSISLDGLPLLEGQYFILLRQGKIEMSLKVLKI